jgi:hypothetical protein
MGTFTPQDFFLSSGIERTLVSRRIRECQHSLLVFSSGELGRHSRVIVDWIVGTTGTRKYSIEAVKSLRPRMQMIASLNSISVADSRKLDRATCTAGPCSCDMHPGINSMGGRSQTSGANYAGSGGYISASIEHPIDGLKIIMHLNGSLEPVRLPVDLHRLAEFSSE